MATSPIIIHVDLARTCVYIGFLFCRFNFQKPRILAPSKIFGHTVQHTSITSSVRRRLLTCTYYWSRTHRLSTTQNTNCACSVLYFGACAELTRLDLNLPCGRAAQYFTITYTMNVIIALTACRDWEAKVWRPKSMVYFFPVLYSQALHKKCTNF